MSNYGDPAPPRGYGTPPTGGYGYAAQANPYAAPQAVAYGGGKLPVPGAAMTWLYLAGWLGFALFIGGFLALAQAVGGAKESLGMFLPLSMFLPLAMPVAASVWLYKSWNAVPPQMRYTDGGKWVTPGAAVGFLFVPFYNWYWVFVANVGLCDAINRTLVMCGGQPRAPKGLAIACSILSLIPYVNYLCFVPWTLYMFMMDAAKKELVNRTGVAAY